MKSYYVICYGMKIAESAKKQLEQYSKVDYFEHITHHNHTDFVAAIQKAQGLIGYGVPIRREMILSAPRLQAVSTISVGYDAFDLDTLNEKKIPLMHTPDILTDSVADAAFALLTATARRTVELDGYIRAGHWQHEMAPSYYGVDIHHKTLGILGMGRIGAAIAKRGYGGFSMPVRYHARTRHYDVERDYQAQFCSLDTLLTKADFLCITLPLTEQTHHLIGHNELAKMKKSSILINIARGAVIDETALIQALQQGVIHAAGLDVFEKEPLPTHSPLLKLNNVVMTPHIGSATQQTREAMQLMAVDNLYRALTGNIDKNCVNSATIMA